VTLWASGDAYEPYIGRWSRLVAAAFVDALNVAPGSRWCDVGCGTGALTATLLDRVAPASVVSVDPSPAFLSYAAAHVVDERATFVPGDATALPLPDASVDAAVSGLVLNFVGDQPRAAAEMARVVRPGGTVAAYVWDLADGMRLVREFWDAAATLDPATRALDEGRLYPLCAPDALGALFADLRDVVVADVTVPTVFRDFDDYWTPFLGGVGPAPQYVASLDDAARERLRETLRTRLPYAADGTIPLTARAWSVRATR
jgi:SAM-dependent methyltransferase